MNTTTITTTTTTAAALIKSHFLHHTSLFPIHSKPPPPPPPPPKSSFDNNPAFLGPRTKLLHNHSSNKSLCFVVKSNHRDEDAIIVSRHRDEAVDDEELKSRTRRMMIVTGAAASVGLMAVLMGQDKAWALGPEGPMVEEFWENVRRYALYALTVSTGVLYAVLQPIVELLKNPISAVLIILIIGGSFFIFSQILSAMFGVSDFAYQYAY